MSAPWTQDWFDLCELVYGKTLTGTYRHYCPDNSYFPIDETTKYFDNCVCFRCTGCHAVLITYRSPHGLPTRIHEDAFECPNKRFWNFWKHDFIDYWLYERVGRPK